MIADGATLGNASLVVQPIHNHGVIRKSATAGVARLESAFNWYLYNHTGGRIEVPDGTLVCASRLETASEIHVGPGATFHQSSWASYQPGASFTGDGLFLLTGNNNFVADGFELPVSRMAIEGTIGGGQGLSGPGTLRVSQSIELRGGYCETLATVQPGATLTVAGPGFTQTRGWENYGAAIVLAGGMNYFLPFNNHPGALVDIRDDVAFGGRFGNGVLNNAGRLVKSAGGGDATMLGTLNNSGEVELRTGRLVVDVLTQSAGVTRLAGGSARTNMTLTGGTLTGTGVLTANVTNTAGVVEPGASAGTLQLAADGGILGDYSQGVGGSLRIQIGGLAPGAQHDQLAVARHATLNGGLSVQRVDGFHPQLGDQFVIVTCGGNRTGTFARVSGVQLGGGLRFNVQYNPGNVTLTVATGGVTPGDLNGDGSVGLADLTAFLSSFGLCDGQTGFNPAADFNGDGCVSITDLTILLSNFGL